VGRAYRRLPSVPAAIPAPRRGSLSTADLAGINAAGDYAQLVAAHVGGRGATAAAIETEDAALAAGTEVAAHNVTDLDRRLNQLDGAIESSDQARQGGGGSFSNRRAAQSPCGVGWRAAAGGEVFAALKAERAALGAQCRRIEAQAAPIKYVAELLGIDTDSERAIRWLIALNGAVLRSAGDCGDGRGVSFQHKSASA
jgi:hypothetical protein